MNTNKIDTNSIINKLINPIFIDSPPEPGKEYNQETWNEKYGAGFAIFRFSTNEVYYPKHWTSFSLKYALKGDEIYQFDKMKYRVSKSGFLLLNEGAEYESYIKANNEETESFCIYYSNQVLISLLAAMNEKADKLLDGNFSSESKSQHFSEQLYPVNNDAGNLLLKIKTATDNNADTYTIMEYLVELYEELLKLNADVDEKINSVEAVKKSTRIELYKRLQKVTDYIESCYKEELDLPLLSKICCLDQYYMLREFKKVYKITPYKYIMTKRITEAKELLSSTTIPVSEIASSLGFYDISHFSNIFKQHTSVSPQAYRLKKTNMTLMKFCEG